MKQILGVILLIANGMILSIILSCFKDALRDAKKSKTQDFLDNCWIRCRCMGVLYLGIFNFNVWSNLYFLKTVIKT